MPIVFLFYPFENSAMTKNLRDRVEGICREHEWSYRPRPIQTKRSRNGRPVALLDLDVARGLYPLVHRSRVATLVADVSPRVPLHPVEAEVVQFGRHMTLRRFLEYKSCWIPVRVNSLNDSWAGMFAGWCERVECEGEHDPRCLPFHVFRGNGDGLEHPDRRAGFDVAYGAGARRIDDNGTEWNSNPGDFHGNESLFVAGFQLRPGCHWDVIGQRLRIQTPRGVWFGTGHVNIYPDAHIRTKGANFRKVE